MKLLAFMLAVSLSCFSLPSVGEISSVSQAINESGRLRMLTQRMAKAYLLNAMEIQPEKAHQQFTQSIQTFERNLIDLHQFSLTLNSPVAVTLGLEQVTTQWATYKLALKSHTQAHNPSSLLRLSDQTLQACEILVSTLEKAAQRSSARWVNLSGRQRMLSQRIAKLYSAISLSGDIQRYGDGLKQAVKEFDDALITLINSPDNTHFVNHKLKKVATQWQFSKQGFKVLDKGNSTPLVISMTTETILKQMNDITALYEEIDRNTKQLASQ